MSGGSLLIKLMRLIFKQFLPSHGKSALVWRTGRTSVISLAIGHLLGGSEVDKRSALAIACIARNIGLAMYIAVFSNAQEQVLPTLVSYIILGSLIAIPYSTWSKRQVVRVKPAQSIGEKLVD